jgi:hypothetical protein
MNYDRTIRITNHVALYACIVFVYWVGIYSVATVFNLKVFKDNVTNAFGMSLVGILAVLAASIILNVMANLSKISAAVSAPRGQAVAQQAMPARGWTWRATALILPFLLIVGALFVGDYFSAQRQQQVLLASARRLVAENQVALRQLAYYQFDAHYISQAQQNLQVLNKIDKNFPQVMAILPDTIGDKPFFLAWDGTSYDDSQNEKTPPRKVDFIYSTTPEERDYLTRVFAGTRTDPWVHIEKDRYQLYFPAMIDGKRLVLYLSDDRSGKFSS